MVRRFRTLLTLAAIAAAGFASTGAHAAPLAARSVARSGTPGGMAAVDYTVKGAPLSGLDSLNYPIRVVEKATGGSGWLWAEEWNFTGGQTADLALKPSHGGTASFTVFGPGTTTHASQCTPGAGGHSGTTCRVHFHWSVGRDYSLTVSLRAETRTRLTWIATATDLASQSTRTVGVVSVPVGWGLLSVGSGSFAEYLAPVPDCAAIPRMVVRFSAPTGHRAGKAYRGSVIHAFAYGSSGPGELDCSDVVSITRTRHQAVVAAPRGHAGG